MSDRQTMRQADDVSSEVPAGPYDLDGFAGTWVSSDRATHGIARLELAVRGGELFGRVFGVGAGTLIDGGETPASALYTGGVTSRQAVGFVLDYELGALHSHIQVNLKLGVAVLGVHQSFQDGRRGLFFREFMARDDVGPVDRVKAPDPEFCLADAGAGTWDADGEIDPRVLVGRFKNTNASSRGLRAVTVTGDGRGIVLRATGAGAAGPIDWGEARGELFACLEEDDAPSAASLVRYDFGFMTSELQVRQNKGILAVTSFNRFHDGSGRSDYVTRELFYREAGP